MNVLMQRQTKLKLLGDTVLSIEALVTVDFFFYEETVIEDHEVQLKAMEKASGPWVKIVLSFLRAVLLQHAVKQDFIHPIF